MIYDCFTYFNDDLITELRLNTLNKYVDKFVIVEATTDHSGKDKELNFKLNKFSNFKDKIRYIVVDDLPKNTKSFYHNRRMWHKNMVREEYQRNQILKKTIMLQVRKFLAFKMVLLSQVTICLQLHF